MQKETQKSSLKLWHNPIKFKTKVEYDVFVWKLRGFNTVLIKIK